MSDAKHFVPTAGSDPFRAIVDLIEPQGGAAIDAAAVAGESWPYGFAMLAAGLHWIGDGEAPPMFLAAPFRVVGFSRDDLNGSWGLVISFADRDEVNKTVTLAAAELVGDGAAVLRRLAAAGLVVAGRKAAKDRLIEALGGVGTAARARLVSCTGWDAALSYFAMPEQTFGGAEALVFDGSTRAANFGVSGSLAAWQNWVGEHVSTHARLVSAASVAFAGPLLGVLGAEPAIWHFRGRSSSGKSTALRVGASVWGPPALVNSWRGTANGFEVVAALHSDLLLILDELSVADARSVGDSVYMLANGVAKSRMASDGSLKSVRRWRTNVLSSGEISLADKLGEDGRRHLATAGQGVRFVELPIDPSHETGVFDGSSTKEAAAALADAIKAVSGKSYGRAGPAFLEKLVADVAGSRREAIGFVDNFMATAVPRGADGQVTRVARKFATVAAAGELAVKWNILPPCFRWGDVTEAAAALFAAWLGDRGGDGATEDHQAILRTKAFLAANASARMPPLRVDDEGLAFKSSFRAQMIAGYQDAAHFYVSDGGFKEALCGLDATAAADALFRHGFLVKSADAGRRKTYVSTPEGRQRLYKILRTIMEHDDGI